MPSNSRKAADKPWSDHSDVIAKFSELCARQIDAGMEEARHEITCISQSILHIADEIGKLDTGSETTQRGTNHDETRPYPKSIFTALNSALTELQFADRLHQRMSNVRNNLLQFSALVSSPAPSIAEDSWTEFLREIRDTFTIEDERIIFDSVMHGQADNLTGDKAIVPDLSDGDIADER